MRERKTIIDIPLNQKTIVVEQCNAPYRGHPRNFHILQRHICKYVNSATHATVFQLVRTLQGGVTVNQTHTS